MLNTTEIMTGMRVKVTNESRLDHAFEGRTGIALYATKPHGFIRIRLDGDTTTVLVHPESLSAET